MAQRGEVLYDLVTPLDVVEDHAGQAGELTADQHDRALDRDLVQVLVGQPAGGEHEAVDRGGPAAGPGPTRSRGDSSALTSTRVYSEAFARCSAPRISSK